MADKPDVPQSLQELIEKREEQIPRITKLFKFAQPHHVRHNEIDTQGVVGNGAWADILTMARMEYLRNLGLLSLEGMGAPVQAIVRTSVMEYLAPARFDDSLLVRVRASHLGHKSARFEYLADNIDTSLRHALGATVLVCVDLKSFKSIQWPQVWRDRLSEFEGEDLVLGQK